MNEPKAIIKDGKITNAQELKSYWRDKYERDYWIQRDAFINGWNVPGDLEPEPPATPRPQEVIHRHSNMSKQDYDLLQQTSARVKYLEKKLAERDQTIKKVKSKYT